MYFNVCNVFNKTLYIKPQFDVEKCVFACKQKNGSIIGISIMKKMEIKGRTLR
jgi:hypothetical protein